MSTALCEPPPREAGPVEIESAVARTVVSAAGLLAEHFRPGATETRLAAFLVGRLVDPRAIEAGVTRSPAYGSLSFLSMKQARHLVVLAVEAGLLAGVEGTHGRLAATPAGEALARGFGSFVASLLARVAPAVPRLTPEKLPRLQALVRLRQRLQAMLRLPAYRIITNRTLLAIGDASPATPEELRKVPGVGDAMVRQYGQVILAALADPAGSPVFTPAVPDGVPAG